MREWLFILVLASMVVGCGGDDGPAGDTDAGPVGDSGPTPGTDAGPMLPVYEEPPRGAPISDSEAPENTWTWIPVPGTRCMNDTETGFAVNRSTASNNVVIFLEGGGACFNDFTCATVAHSGGFGMSDFTDLVRTYGSRGIFNRADADNPFRDWTLIFIPYCSGDVFAGLAEDGYDGDGIERVQVGYANMGLFLSRIVPTYEGADQVVLTGSSAGGFGAAWNYHRTAQLFGSTEVILLDDSGPALGDTWMAPCLQRRWRDLWNLNATIPAGCTECRAGDGGLVNMTTWLAREYPERRFGLISSMADGVIRIFFGIGTTETCNKPDRLRADAFGAGLLDLRDNVLAPYDNFHSFYIPGDKHVWLGDDPVGATVIGGVSLTDWIRGLLTGDPSWGNVGP